jgi:hypothetical protein
MEWYRSQFADGAGRKAIGECSNVYSERKIYPRAAERLAEHLPQAKLIYMVRDPLPRIASLWMQHRSHGGERVHHDFEVALRRNRDLLIDSSNYWRQLEAYRAHFPDERILVLFFEDFQSDPDGVLKECCRFLDVDAGRSADLLSAHQNPSEGKIGAPAWLSRLREHRSYRALRSLLPANLRLKLRERLIFEEIPRPRWLPGTRRWVLEELRDDSLKLLASRGKPSDFWSLEP